MLNAETYFVPTPAIPASDKLAIAQFRKALKQPKAPQAKNIKLDNTYILHETATVVVLASGFTKPSANAKTGPMIQIWILNKAENPMESVLSGSDSNNCLNCFFRPALFHDALQQGLIPQGSKRCYVNKSKAPRSLWVKFTKGGYTALPSIELFRHKSVRFGAYGEPVLIPLEIVASIVDVAKMHTGYTHDWRNPLRSGYKRFFMASTMESDYAEAKRLGWRAFSVATQSNGADSLCPASHEFRAAHPGRKPIQCIDCGLCSGLSRKDSHGQLIENRARDIFIPAHA